MVAGFGCIAAAQALAPLDAPPLYDGVVVEEPYRYLSPAPGEAGNPTSASVTRPLENGASPAFGASTSESPPQAQLIAPPGGFDVRVGTTELWISITPVAPAPPDSTVGNAYRFEVTDENGVSVRIAAGSSPTLVLRAPPEASEVRIVRLVDGAWQELPTRRAGQPSSYLTNVDALGEFAVRGTVAQGGGGVGLDLRFVAAGAMVAAGSVVVLLVLVRPRRPAKARPPPARRTPVPRKQRRRRG